MKVDINTKYIKDKDGVDHFAIKNYKYTFDYGDRVQFDLQNLFKESKQLSEYSVTVILLSVKFGNMICPYIEVALDNDNDNSGRTT